MLYINGLTVLQALLTPATHSLCMYRGLVHGGVEGEGVIYNV